MLSAALLSALAVSAVTSAAEVHGSGAQGSVMGPVAFLWPSDRAWDGAHDNVGPCGSPASVVNRTEFPIGSIGSIELTIADEAYDLAVRIAYGNNPTSQDQFQTIKGNVAELEPGHQCYPMSSSTSTATSGQNATIQLEYRANDSDKDEIFYACADITFVEAAAFTQQVMCFNVTASEFEPVDPSTTTSSTPSSTAVSDAAAAVPSPGPSQGGLSAGAKAGIAVGTIVGAGLLFAAIFFALRRKRTTAKDTEARAPMEKVRSDSASIGSAATAH